jgi:hypothetical protein
MRGRIAVAAALLILSTAAVRPQSIPSSPLPFPPVATFSILGYDAATGEVGGAVQSRVFSVGNGVLWAEADTGVAATQAIVDVSYGPKALALLRAGMSPSAIVKGILESDPDPRPADWTKEGRQFAVMDAKGNYAAYTGPKATPWAGNKSGAFCTAQGNILAGQAVRWFSEYGIHRMPPSNRRRCPGHHLQRRTIEARGDRPTLRSKSVQGC